MAEKKITKKEWFDIVAEIVENSDYEDKTGVLNFINHEKELLDNKSSKGRATKKRASNEEIKVTILEVMEELAKPVTISELLEHEKLQNYTEEKAGTSFLLKMTSQKLSSLVSQLKKEGLVVRTEDKKKAYFSLPENKEEADTE